MTSSRGFRAGAAGSSFRTRPVSAPRRLSAAVAATTFLAALTGCVPTAAEPLTTPAAGSSSPRASAAPAPITATQTPPAPASPPMLGDGVAPAQVRIPAIELDEPLIGLGIKADGTMGVPADWDAVGWFTGGGKPGGRGPTVIAGHVDSVTAPAVFSRLAELVPGDTVEVVDVDGALVTYAVDEVLDVPKADFPTGRVFGALPTDELRLITCGGFFDPAAASYEDNRVVFASRA